MWPKLIVFEVLPEKAQKKYGLMLKKMLGNDDFQPTLLNSCNLHFKTPHLSK